MWFPPHIEATVGTIKLYLPIKLLDPIVKLQTGTLLPKL